MDSSDMSEEESNDSTNPPGPPVEVISILDQLQSLTCHETERFCEIPPMESRGPPLAIIVKTLK